jgi:folate-binding protein YgfZ
MITNDIGHFSYQNCINSFFLNKLGRVLYDSLIYKLPSIEKEQQETYLIECDENISSELLKHLKIYRVRRKIDISNIDDKLRCWSLFDTQDKLQRNGIKIRSDNTVLAFQDPRLKNLGYRLLLQENVNLNELLEKLECKPDISEDDKEYHQFRYKLGVSEGVTDILPGKSFPLEANLDYLHGVSFHKGCYIGQELTARTHHTGVVRKRLMPLKFEVPIDQFEVNSDILNSENKTVGKLRNVIGEYGLGLMRIEPTLAANSLSMNNVKCTTRKPFWWPIEAKKTSSRL